MKKSIKMLLALTLAVGMLAGCGSATLNNVPTDIQTAGPSESTAAPREFAVQIAQPQEVPAIATENDVTPAEFADILLVENKSPFTSQYMECEPEDFERRYDVYALGVTNISDKTIENLTLTYSNGEQDLIFHVQMLPVGWTVVPMDLDGTAVTASDLTYVSGQVNFLEGVREVTDEVELTETMNGTVIVKNMTNEEMPAVVVYYRDVDYLGNVMAGRCFSVTSESLIPGWQEELETEQWLPSCVIVNVVVLDQHPDDAQ